MKDNNIRALEDFAIWIIENVRSKGVLYEGDIMLTASDLDLVKHKADIKPRKYQHQMKVHDEAAREMGIL